MQDAGLSSANCLSRAQWKVKVKSGRGRLEPWFNRANSFRPSQLRGEGRADSVLTSHAVILSRPH